MSNLPGRPNHTRLFRHQPRRRRLRDIEIAELIRVANAAYDEPGCVLCGQAGGHGGDGCPMTRDESYD